MRRRIGEEERRRGEKVHEEAKFKRATVAFTCTTSSPWWSIFTNVAIPPLLNTAAQLFATNQKIQRGRGGREREGGREGGGGGGGGGESTIARHVTKRCDEGR